MRPSGLHKDILNITQKLNTTTFQASKEWGLIDFEESLATPCWFSVGSLPRLTSASYICRPHALGHFAYRTVSGNARRDRTKTMKMREDGTDKGTDNGHCGNHYDDGDDLNACL